MSCSLTNNNIKTNLKHIISFLEIIDDISILEEVSKYFSNIYDLLSLFYVNKTVLKHFNLMFYPLLETIIKNNLGHILTRKLNISYIDFEYNILKKLGLVLSGSSMLLAICGKNWAHNNNNFNDTNNKMMKKQNVLINRRVYFSTQTLRKRHNLNFNLYVKTPINNSVHSLSEILMNHSIEYNYTFPNDMDIIGFFLTTYLQYLRLYFSNTLNQYLINEYVVILRTYNYLRTNDEKLVFVKKCFERKRVKIF